MKYSEVEWIGEIPDNWKIIKSKYVVDIFTGNSIKDEDKDLYTNKLDSDIYLSTKNIDVKTGKLLLNDVLYVKKDDTNFVRANKDDILMCIEGGSAGRKKTFLADTFTFVNKLCCFHATKIYPKFLFYVLQSPHYESEFNLNLSGMIGGVTKGKLNTFMYPFPSNDKQISISLLLDKKIPEIDSLIEIENKQIEKLKEYKQAIITEAVTKGLDKNAPMKDSGVEWIGKISEWWSVQKVLYQLSMPVTDGPHTTPELQPEGIAFVSAEAVSCGNGGIDFSHIRGYITEEFYQECCLKYIPEIDDIYMIKSGATTGRVSIVTTLEPKFTIWSPLAVMRCDKNKMFPKFLFYAVQSEQFQRQVALGWSFGTQQNLGMRTLEQLKLILPSLSEQKVIANYLDAKIESIEKIIEVKDKKIKRLGEYKKSLIYEYVTGKKEVC